LSKVIVVTGASAGIGKACADRLHNSGWTVFGASRRATSCGAWTPIAMDVDDDAAVAEGVNRILRDRGRIDAVVACAGWGLAGPVEDTPIAAAKDQFETNFWGAVRLVQASLPAMRQQGGGRIVLVSSLGGLIGLPFQAFYSASKFAMEGYGEALAYEIAPFGIQVTLVEPGNIVTDFTSARRQVGLPGGDSRYTAAAARSDSPYAAASDKAITVMERDEQNGASPDVVAAVIERVLLEKRAPRRISAGKFDERIGVLAKRLLPHSLFEKAARSSLGV
jgi:NAD(P)-dependent dehydrogenase (short-subunit alcohol dehydrogenase family)